MDIWYHIKHMLVWLLHFYRCLFFFRAWLFDTWKEVIQWLSLRKSKVRTEIHFRSYEAMLEWNTRRKALLWYLFTKTWKLIWFEDILKFKSKSWPDLFCLSNEVKIRFVGVSWTISWEAVSKSENWKCKVQKAISNFKVKEGILYTC